MYGSLVIVPVMIYAHYRLQTDSTAVSSSHLYQFYPFSVIRVLVILQRCVGASCVVSGMSTYRSSLKASPLPNSDPQLVEGSASTYTAR